LNINVYIYTERPSSLTCPVCRIYSVYADSSSSNLIVSRLTKQQNSQKSSSQIYKSQEMPAR